MNESNLQILVQLKDEASAEFKKVGDSFEKTGNAMSSKMGFLNKDVTGFTKVLAGTALAVGGMAVAFGVDAVRSFSQAQASMTRVDSILQTMGKTAMQNKEAILSAADAAVRLGFDDEAAAESITKLYQRTGDLTEAMKLNSFAMDLARFKNISLDEASRAVNMALSGNVRMLKELGVIADETLSPLDAIAQAQKVVANQAQNFSQTFQGQMLIITETWSNFKDGIGSALVDALMPFVKQFNEWLINPQTKQSIAEWTETFKSWAEVIIPTIVETFRIWISVLDTVLSTLIKIGDAITAAFNAYNRFTNATGSAIKTGGKAVVSGLTSVGHALGFAEGGIVTKPTLAMIGEAGESEAVIPLSKMGSIGGGQSIIVNMTGTFYTESEVATRMGNQIARVIGQQLKIRTI